MIRKEQITEVPTLYGYTNLLINLRNLWLDLAIWTRNYMVSNISGYGNVDMVGNRLYRIPTDFYARLQLIFGPQNSQELVSLLSQHIILMMETSNAIKNGNNDAASANTAQLYQNSSDIANYFAELNPYWTAVQWKTLLDQYISMTLQEMVALSSGDFERDIDIYDRLTYFTVFLADYMTQGIVSYLTFRGNQQTPQ